MSHDPDKKELVNQLRKDILLLEGYATSQDRGNSAGHFGLGPLEAAFPGGVFPTGVIHEFLCPSPEHAAATGGFASGLLCKLMQGGGACLWISQHRVVFPSGLAIFQVKADQVIFAHLPRAKDVVWGALEALACQGLAAVVMEVQELDFTTSRKLQLAAAGSGVTGLVLLKGSAYRASACAARWQVSPLPSLATPGMPGVGHPRWQVELLKVRSGRPGSYQLSWQAGAFVPVAKTRTENNSKAGYQERKAG